MAITKVTNPAINRLRRVGDQPSCQGRVSRVLAQVFAGVGPCSCLRWPSAEENQILFYCRPSSFVFQQTLVGDCGPAKAEPLCAAGVSTPDCVPVKKL